MSLPPLIRALLEPARYGGEVAEVRLEQTHISWVLLAGGTLAWLASNPWRSRGTSAPGGACAR